MRSIWYTILLHSLHSCDAAASVSPAACAAELYVSTGRVRGKEKPGKKLGTAQQGRVTLLNFFCT